MTTRILTQDELKTQLHYDPDTGIFTWKVSNSNRIKVGSKAGCFNRGYILIRICNRLIPAHRLAFFYIAGYLPKSGIDHINGNPNDNRWINLRECTQQENMLNTKKHKDNKSGYKGVCWDKNKKKWLAQACINYKTTWLGFFETAEKASEAYQDFCKENHGDFYYVKNH